VTLAAEALLREECGTIAALIDAHARERPAATALIQDGHRLDYAGLNRLMNRVATALQRDGVSPGDIIAICAKTSTAYAAVFLGALRAGVAVAPLAPSSTPRAIASMVADCDAKLLFLDETVAQALAAVELPAQVQRVALDGSADGQSFATWLAAADAVPAPVRLDPERAFNIIYSSGTTGEPKGIVHSYAMRWLQLTRANAVGYAAASVTIVSTPLYSNTTLVSFLPTLGYGGTAVLMEKFDAVGFLQLAEQHRATHAMLVPVQYRRIMAVPDFDRYDLASFVMKLSTSAPFAADVKADVLRRWPGGLTEYYGLTEGGGSCVLVAHLHPDKLHTVGQPSAGHDIRLIDETGKEVPKGEIGEIVGHSAGIMSGYYQRPERTREAEWRDASGKRFIRSGDVGRFDADGFLVLMDRKKDMIISGGFNIYPSDLEAVLAKHEAIAEAAVVGVASNQWGETPVAFVVLKAGSRQRPEEIRDWLNGQVGKTQRLSDVEIVPALPRSAIGKVLKRELRDRFGRGRGA
jgi:long-chain acyl-CoA synthetase